ncbi:Fucosyltransferase [Mactra antiquata]
MRASSYVCAVFLLVMSIVVTGIWMPRYLDTKTVKIRATHKEIKQDGRTSDERKIVVVDASVKREPKPEKEERSEQLAFDDKENTAEDVKYLVVWYSVMSFLRNRPDAISKDFSPCEYSNCELSYDKGFARVADVLIFDGRLTTKRPFIKPYDQIWIFAAHESLDFLNRCKRSFDLAALRHLFNWTMTYHSQSDIPLPYGEIRERPSKNKLRRNFTEIAKEKKITSLIITSNCETQSRRMLYLQELYEYADIKVLGNCGEKWECGERTIHNECFDILNHTYGFYLAFENAACDEYFTEKLFENYKYDILFVVRGGCDGQSWTMFPEGSVISVDDFDSFGELGNFLESALASKEKYAKLLEEKSKFYAVGYADMYQKALCEICFRLNHKEKFYKEIPSVIDELNSYQKCADPIMN